MIKKQINVHLAGDDLKKFRGLMSFYSKDEILNPPPTEIIRKIVRAEYARLRKEKLIPDYLKD